jgi:hypothetical protein
VPDADPGYLVATQALWDIYGVLGYDQDGDRTPSAVIAGAGSVERFAEQMVAAAREHVADDLANDQEMDTRNRELTQELARLRAGSEPMPPQPSPHYPTPGELWTALLSHDPEDRLADLAQLQRLARQAHECFIRDHPGRIKYLDESRRALRADYDRMEQGYGREMHEADQILGKARGYPEYDEVNFPEPEARGQVCTGEHTLPSLAAEVADRLKQVEAELAEANRRIASQNEKLKTNPRISVWVAWKAFRMAMRSQRRYRDQNKLLRREINEVRARCRELDAAVCELVEREGET